MIMANTLSQAVSLLQSGRVDEALKHLSQLSSVQPVNADVFSWLAVANVRARRFQDAQRAIERAIQISPANAGFYLTAANIQQDLGNLPNAVELLRQAIRIQPAFAEGHNNLGIVLTDLGRIDEAIPAFLEAINLKPGYARAYANLAAAQLRSLQFKDALGRRNVRRNCNLTMHMLTTLPGTRWRWQAMRWLQKLHSRSLCDLNPTLSSHRFCWPRR